MREIIFRGKNNKGIWCYGNLILRKDGTYLISPDETPLGHYGAVYKESVGQFTGLKDKNGKEIYEGDIVKIDDDYELYGFFAGESYQIYFKNGAFRLKPKYKSEKTKGCCIDDAEGMTIVGNIYDNLDLIKE